MKKETKEYNFDWNMWTILENASKTPDGFQKEYETLLPYIPNYRDVLDTFVRQGEPGVLFLKLLAKYTNDCVRAHAEGRKTAGVTFCLATPIMYAFNIQPVTLEPWSVVGTMVLKRGTSEFLDYCCELGFTETSCSSQRGILGAYLSDLMTNLDFVVYDSPGICDTNANSFSFAASYLDIPFYQLNYPFTLTDEQAREYHRTDFRGLIAFLEEQTGTKINMEKLREVVKESKRQDELACELLDLQRLRPCPMPPIYDVMFYGGRFMMNGTKEYTELLESMIRKVKEIAKLGIAGTSSGKEKARGFFCYIDHYTTDGRFWDFLDKRDISHMGSILFNFWQKDSARAVGREEEGYSFDDSSFDGIIDSLADQMSRMPMVKQIRGPYDAPGMWLDDTLGAVNLMKADFVVYMGTMGCRNTWGMVKPFVRDLEKRGIPTLYLYADGFDDRVQSWESVADKIGEFLDVRKIMA
ncbi:MAG: 2-hydroxyacyl-CoA dehydratase family protein [Smithella sp.]|jgi:hypothetical protein